MVRIELLGAPRLLVDEMAVSRIPLRIAALLWYLAAQPERSFHREELVALLWEDCDDREGRVRLNSTLHRLRLLLPVWPIDTTRHTVAWRLSPEIELDIARFQASLAACPADAHPTARREALEAALQLWRGPFLAGFSLPTLGYEDWLRQSRTAWESTVLEAWEELIRLEAQAAEWQRVRRHAQEALQVDFWQERFHRWLIEAWGHEGNRPAAIAHFELWRRQLQEEWGLEPGEEIAALAASLRESQARTSPRPPTAPAVRELPRRTLPRPPAWEPAWVGRERELAEALAQLTRASREGPLAVVVEGLSGMGKTRFLRRLAELCSAGPSHRTAYAAACWATCHQATQAVPGSPWAAILRSTWRPDAWDAVPPRLRPWLTRLAPEIPPGPEEVPAAPPVTEAEGWVMVAEGLLHLWQALPGPLLLCLDDWQWADQGSWTVLHHLLTAGATLSLGIALSLRPDQVPSWGRSLLECWTTETVAAVAQLAPFTLDEVRALVERNRGSASLAPAQALFAWTQGHPLFVSVLLQKWDPATEPDWVDSPAQWTGDEGLRRTVNRWASGLSDAAARLMEALAIFPAPVAFMLVCRVAKLEEEVAAQAWRELLAQAIVREIDLASPSGSAYAGFYSRFAGPRVALYHELVREVVAAQIPRVLWASMHRAVLEWVSGATGVTPEDAACFAYHAQEAGLWSEAARWALAVAEAAERRGVFTAAVQWLERAASHLDRLGRDPQWRHLVVDIRLRMALLSWHMSPDYAATVVGAFPPHERRALPGEQRVGWFTRQAEWLMLGGRVQRAGQIAGRLIPLAARLGHPGLEGMVRLRWAQLEALQGRFRNAVDGFAASAPLLCSASLPLWYAQCLGTWASTLATLGDFAQAKAVLAKLTEDEVTMETPTVPLLATLHELTIYTQQEAWKTAVEIGQQLLPMLQAGQHDALEYIGLTFLGLPVARLGDVSGGERILMTAIHLSERLHIRILRDRAYAYLAEVLYLAGQLEAAHRATQYALEIAVADGYAFGQAMALRMLGVLAEDPKDAHQLLEQARRQFTEMGAHPDAARCYRWLAAKAAEPERQATFTAMAKALFDPQAFQEE